MIDSDDDEPMPLELTFKTNHSEFTVNGPLMDMIIEYLLEPAEAFAYALRLPHVRILARLGVPFNPTKAVAVAIRTRNQENAIAVTARHVRGVNWRLVVQEAKGEKRTAIWSKLCAQYPEILVKVGSSSSSGHWSASAISVREREIMEVYRAADRARRARLYGAIIAIPE